VSRELHHELAPRGAGDYRREAEALVDAVRAGDAAAVARGREAVGDRIDERFVLADALHVLAVEHGHRSWPAFKRELEAQEGAAVRPVYRIGAFGHAHYEHWAGRLLAAARASDADALGRLRTRVPRLRDADDATIAADATEADARVCLAREYGFPTWAELAEATDRACDTHYSRLPPELPWKQGEAAIRAGDVERLRTVLEQHPGVEHEDPGMTLLVAATQPEAVDVPREIVDLLIEAGSTQLDDALSVAACFNKPDQVGWLLDAGADPAGCEAVSPLQSAAYHGSREAADALVARTGIVPDTFYLAAAAGDLDRLRAWFRDDGTLRPEAARDRPGFSDVGWPGRAVRDDLADVLAEALALAAHLGRTAACELLLDRGADPARAPLYGLTPLHFAASMGRRETIELLVARGAPLDAKDRLHDGTPLGWALHNADPDEALVKLLGG
jgi:hypothetical protein